MAGRTSTSQHNGGPRRTGTTASQIQGNVAGGATDSGNPVKVAGVYNTTAPAYAAGQRAELQTDAAGLLKIIPWTMNGGGIGQMLGLSATNVDGVAVNTVASLLLTVARNTKFNGTTWDRDRKPSGTKILPAAAATTNPDFAKASAGDLWCISGFNAAASVRYLKIYNKASAPTVGTDNPIMVIALPVGAFNLNMNGHYFSTGIAFALTTGAALLDTGALTLADIVGLTLTYA